MYIINFEDITEQPLAYESVADIALYHTDEQELLNCPEIRNVLWVGVGSYIAIHDADELQTMIDDLEEAVDMKKEHGTHE